MNELPLTDGSGFGKPRAFLAAIDRVLYPITLGYTIVLLGFQVYEFMKGGAFHARYPAADVYLTLLAAYAAQREGGKWLGQDESMMRLRRGELFVGLWFAVFLFVWSLANLSNRWILPDELKTITLGVLAIFAGTGVSAGFRQRMERIRSKPEAADADRLALVFRLLQEKGPKSAEDVQQELGIPKTSAWRILESLVKEGRVVQDENRNSRERRYRLKD